MGGILLFLEEARFRAAVPLGACSTLVGLSKEAALTPGCAFCATSRILPTSRYVAKYDA
jgi:hypothetical protein